MNKSKIVGYEPTGQWRDMHKFNVRFEDGMVGTAFSKSETFRFEIGEEVEYSRNEKNGNLSLNKQQFFGQSIGAPPAPQYAKKEVPSYAPQQSSNALFSKDELIIRQVSLKAAVNYGKESGLDYAQVLAAAEIFNAWILGKQGPVSVDDGTPF